MKVLVIGTGGREHALAWKIAQSPLVSEVLCAPGNPGMATVGRCLPVDIKDIAAVVALAVREQPGLVVVGPEAPLAAGIVDLLAQVNIPAFGPSAAAAALESSKAFTKDFCERHAIPQADYKVFDDAIHAKAYLGVREPPFVIKADGLAQGKGVVIAETRREADAAVDEILFLKKFGTAGQQIVIEDFLPGEEASFFAICDGKTAIAFGGAQDHKRAFDGDKGPNTGGMGAYSPAPILSDTVIQQAMDNIIMPTVRGMDAAGTPFRGVLFAGLMVSSDGPHLIEFNVRFGDPECQTLMALLESDIVPYLLASANGELGSLPAPTFYNDTAVTVVMAAQGYPDAPLTGSVIRGLPNAAAVHGVEIFHAGTRADEDGLLRAAGGRVLNITAIGANVAEAAGRAYDAVAQIDWPGGFCRRDIGWRALTKA